MIAGLFEKIVEKQSLSMEIPYEFLGLSGESFEIYGYKFGHGQKKISLIAGCHADEPVGPMFLRKLVSFFSKQSADFELFQKYSWWIVPQVNPDGEKRNADWQILVDDSYDILKYVKHVIRELPGDDIEFGFSRDKGVRPENLALMDWWQGSFDLHCSMHGMAFAGGPWFLIDEDWKDRAESLISRCSELSKKLSYKLHDVERNGEKGFCRIGRGFCTRPNSNAMKQFFLDQNDSQTAALFRPSSMEYIRSLGGDPLTLVTEMPLFILSGVGDEINPRDKIADHWKEKLADWKLLARTGELSSSEIQKSGIVAMPVKDQMRLQWEFICSGLELLEE